MSKPELKPCKVVNGVPFYHCARCGQEMDSQSDHIYYGPDGLVIHEICCLTAEVARVEKEIKKLKGLVREAKLGIHKWLKSALEEKP